MASVFCFAQSAVRPNILPKRGSAAVRIKHRGRRKKPGWSRILVLAAMMLPEMTLALFGALREAE